MVSTYISSSIFLHVYFLWSHVMPCECTGQTQTHTPGIQSHHLITIRWNLKGHPILPPTQA